MNRLTADRLRASLPLPENDVPCVRILIPGLDTGVFELTHAQYQAAVCAILNTPDDAEALPLHEVEADYEPLIVPANGIWHAFKMARGLRPMAVVVNDTTGE
jgi:hypothetical protein